jgi:hypothetical protein
MALVECSPREVPVAYVSRTSGRGDVMAKGCSYVECLRRESVEGNRNSPPFSRPTVSYISSIRNN